jgi:hypothetical protein
MIGREVIQGTTTIRKESLHEISNYNEVRVVNFTISKNLIVKRKVLLRCNTHKFIWTSPDGKTQNQIGYNLIDMRWY